jgi:multidrug efflux pump subunit AcrB
MLPFDNKSEMQVILNMPEGTPLAVTTRAAQEMAAAATTLPQVTDVQLYVGTAAPINFNGLVRHYDLRAGAHVADLQINLLGKDERDEQSHLLAKRLRPLVTEIAEAYGATVQVAEVPPGPPVLATLVGEAYGPTGEDREALARQVEAIFRATPGVVDVDLLVEAPQPQWTFQVDREKAALHGVAAAQVSRTLRLAVAGEEVGLLHRPREVEAVPVRLEVPRGQASSIVALGQLRLAAQDGTLVPLAELARVEQSTLAPSLHRKNLRPVVYVTGDVASLSGGGESPVYAILDMAEQVAALPGGPELHYRAQPTATEKPTFKWDGEWQITYEVFRDLGAAFGAVLILIYLLIVGWFGSFRTPLVMMIAIPLSLVGILPAHWFFGAFFTATSMIGFIALAGIMVRNSVLLIDFMELSRRGGATLEEAVIQAGAVRLRPILLTAGTVVVGAMVILFDPIFEGLAISLMAGAIASTGLTLIVVPVVYYLMEARHIEENPTSEDSSRETTEA